MHYHMVLGDESRLYKSRNRLIKVCTYQVPPSAEIVRAPMVSAVFQIVRIPLVSVYFSAVDVH